MAAQDSKLGSLILFSRCSYDFTYKLHTKSLKKDAENLMSISGVVKYPKQGTWKKCVTGFIYTLEINQQSYGWSLELLEFKYIDE